MVNNEFDYLWFWDNERQTGDNLKTFMFNVDSKTNTRGFSDDTINSEENDDSVLNPSILSFNCIDSHDTSIIDHREKRNIENIKLKQDREILKAIKKNTN